MGPRPVASLSLSGAPVAEQVIRLPLRGPFDYIASQTGGQICGRPSLAVLPAVGRASGPGRRLLGRAREAADRPGLRGQEGIDRHRPCDLSPPVAHVSEEAALQITAEPTAHRAGASESAPICDRMLSLTTQLCFMAYSHIKLPTGFKFEMTYS